MFEKVPKELVECPQWVLWRTERRGDKDTKIPYQRGAVAAKSNDPATWSTFDDIMRRFEIGGFTGLGFVFAESDPFCGVDLDGCRDPQTGKVESWAKDIAHRFCSYTEVSPSGTGIKIFCRGKWLCDKNKISVKGAAKICDKEPGIEVYDRLRYFAVTGKRMPLSHATEEAQESLDWLRGAFFSSAAPTPIKVDFHSTDAVAERARRYLAKMEPAISGQRGHDKLFHAACVLVLGFCLSEQDAAGLLMSDYNPRCLPPWSEREIVHKVVSAAAQPGARGYLRNASPDRYDSIKVPSYSCPAPAHVPRQTTLAEAALDYVDRLSRGITPLIELGIGDLDYAIAGGVEKGEMVILAARPSHGKSAVALQCIHHWTAQGMKCAIISEEMSALALGKRTVQHLSAIPQEHWGIRCEELRIQVQEYQDAAATCLVIESCGTAENAARAIEKAVAEHGVECVVVDYAQLLRSAGKGRYEQITNTSILLRQLASSQKIVLMVLCQLSRSIESRNKFTPVLSDLKDSGQLEQDADVVVFLVWPHRINSDYPREKFQFFIAKNRNRSINQNVVEAKFVPDRQMILDAMTEAARFHDRGDIAPNNLWAGEGDLPR